VAYITKGGVDGVLAKHGGFGSTYSQSEEEIVICRLLHRQIWNGDINAQKGSLLGTFSYQEKNNNGMVPSLSTETVYTTVQAKAPLQL
jgi:hypothetical protein